MIIFVWFSVKRRTIFLILRNNIENNLHFMYISVTQMGPISIATAYIIKPATEKKLYSMYDNEELLGELVTL